MIKTITRISWGVKASWPSADKQQAQSALRWPTPLMLLLPIGSALLCYLFTCSHHIKRVACVLWSYWQKHTFKTQTLKASDYYFDELLANLQPLFQLPLSWLQSLTFPLLPLCWRSQQAWGWPLGPSDGSGQSSSPVPSTITAAQATCRCFNSWSEMHIKTLRSKLTSVKNQIWIAVRRIVKRLFLQSLVDKMFQTW